MRELSFSLTQSIFLKTRDGIVFILKILYIVIELKLTFRLFNGRPRQVRKGLSSTRAAI